MSHEMLQFIAGERRHGTSENVVSVIEPATGEVITTGYCASEKDVDEAVAAAKAAFRTWSRTTPAERSALLARWAEVLTGRTDEIAAVESRNAGKSIKLVSGFDVPGTIDNVAYFGAIARNLEGKASAEYSADHVEHPARTDRGRRIDRPVELPAADGRVEDPSRRRRRQHDRAQARRAHPALVAAVRRGAAAAGIPAGVINVITGKGRVAGTALIEHPDVAMVSFTGSTDVGKQIGATAVGNVKRVHLELGGKAPFVVFDDADVEAAARAPSRDR